MSDGVEAFLQKLEPGVREIAAALRTEIRSLLPDAVEKTHGGWKIVGYSVDGSMGTTICAIAPHPSHVNLQFFHGTDLEGHDPEGLLEGTGKRARHVKLLAAEDARRPAVTALVRRAGELVRQG